ncbi:MAG: chorismate synthase [Clostridia bacterium]|nr:chorismate synthase [Clostridia bacterium]
MKNTFGNYVSVTLFGESHGAEIGVVMDGLAPGIPVDENFIAEKLKKRRPSGVISTARVEEDKFRIVSGVFGGVTTGAPLCILIPNKNVNSKDYSLLSETPRPSHADFAAHCKYHGNQDYRGGGHFSGRLTAALVAAGAIAQSALLAKGIKIGTHISSIGEISDRWFEDFDSDVERLKENPTLDPIAWHEMQEYIKSVAKEGDSVGGILETAVTGMPKGVGEPWFDGVEGVIARAIYAIPAVKGVEFGAGFGFGKMRGSQANDPFAIRNGEVVTLTNNNGGINGGITNGMPIIFRTAVKPTPSIFIEQQTVNLKTMMDEKLSLKGRHDPAIVHRAAPVVDAMTAIALLDMLCGRFGTDYLIP